MSDPRRAYLKRMENTGTTSATGSRHRAWRHRLIAVWVPVVLALTILVGPGSPLAFGLGADTATTHGQLTTQTGSPNLFDPHTQATSVSHPGLGQTSSAHAKAGPPVSMRRNIPMPMHAGTLALASDHGATFKGSDGKLEVDVPAGAVTAADLATAGGRLSLQISQIAPPSGSNAGGSGLASFGTYLLQLVDAHGVLVTSHGLRRPITIKYHVGKGESAFDLSRVFVIFNGSLPDGTALAPLAAPQPGTHGVQQDAPASAPAPTQANSHFGSPSSQNAQFDTAAKTLTVTTSLSGPSTSTSWNTDSPVATFGKPDPFNVDLNAGSLTGSFSIDTPSGPGGLTPPVTLSYSSASTAEQHSPQGAAGWTGEGWNLDLGAVSWAEHDSNSSCTSGCGNGWEDTWQLSDPFGTGSELIPPNINVSTYWDDSPYYYCDTKISPNYPCPIRWHSAPESHAQIWAYVGPLTLPDGAGAHAPCFRVYLTNGVMEEFGCTANSLEYYFTPGMGDYISSWKLDLITDPQGNQIHLTYTQDVEQKNVSGVNHTYIRDAVLNTIEWDSPSCHNAQSMCTGSSWAPLMRVSFAASHSPARLTNSPSGCNTGSNLRCDDPKDLSGSGGLAAPDVQSTYVLNDIFEQVRTSGTGSWNTLKDYQLSYAQNGPSTISADPSTGKQESVAGYLLLSKLVTVGDDNSTSLPTRTFAYTTQTQYYEDDVYHPTPTTNCGPSWNTGHGSGCLLWSQSYAGNSYYLSTADNGLGLHQIFSWQDGRNNTHGVNGGGSNTANPLYCNGPTGYPCNEADDQNWSHTILTQQEGDVYRATSASGGNVLVQSITKYGYKLTYPLPAQECGDCVAGMYWGNQNDGDYLDYYNGQFMGFAEADVTNPDGSYEVHKYDATQGYGVYDSTVPCLAYTPPCHVAPWWNLTNAAHGHETEADYYDTNGTTLLKKDTTQYSATCPPSGVSGTPPWSATVNGNPYTYTWDGNLVAELDHGDPVAACDVQTTRTDEYTYDGASGTVPQKTTTFTYDSYGRTTSTTVSSNGGGGATGSPTTIVTHNDYIQNDAVNAQYGSVTGTYLIDFTADTITEDSSNTTHYSCSFTSYDGKAFATGQQSGLTLGEATTHTQYTSCGTSSNGFATSGPLTTTHTYDTYGNQLTTDDPDANAGISSHLGCTSGGTTTYSSCATFDGVFHTLTTSTANALNQIEQTGYATGSPAAGNGFGLWEVSSTDKNGQTTTYGYDALGRMTSRTLPGETSSDTTSTWAYTDWCAATGAQTPCVEVDETQRLNSSDTITSRAFYDGYGNLVETRDPAAGGNDIIRYREYDPSERDIFDSISYLVPAYSGGPGAAGFSTPDATQPGTQTVYDGLDRATKVTDALSNVTTTSYSVECGALSDSACYAVTTTVDPNSHQASTFTDALGRETYDQAFSGNSPSTYAVYASTTYTYDFNGNQTQILQPNGTSKTTFTYDAAGRKTGMTDPDRGAESYTYDADGNRTQSVDARGANGTVYAGYDGIDRQIWRNTTNSSSGAYVTYSFDDTANGNYGIGHLTSENFTGGPNRTLSGAYSYVYDQRGQQISETETAGSPATNYTVGTTYDDSGNVLTQTYPDGETVTNGYTAQGWLAQVTTQQGSNPATTLLSNVDYSGIGGAAHLLTGATLGGSLYRYAASYDALLRLTNVSLTLLSNNSTLWQETRNFDAAGNLTRLDTTVPAGTDNQSFCYDEQDRLTWASSYSGTGPCGIVNNGGSLTAQGAKYTATYAYDTLGRLTSGPLGTYTYGDSAHLHAATSIGSSYTASYDASGDMTCRAPSSSTTCAGSSQTGAQLGYDDEGQLTSWQNTPSSPTSTDAYLYDGEGNRVEQQSTSSNSQNTTTTTVVYIGNLEEVSNRVCTGSLCPAFNQAPQPTTYYYAGTTRIAVGVGVTHTISYLMTDALGSSTMALDGAGNVSAVQLYDPYGNGRYSTGTMPGSYGYTGQHSDSVTGLDYYGARYYDPLASQFVSADTMLPGNGYDPWGLSRYAYVEGNPLIRTDPMGHDGGWLGGLVSAVTSTVSTVANAVVSAAPAVASAAWTALDYTTGIPSMIGDVQTIFSGNTSFLDKVMAVGDIALNVAMDVSMVAGVGEGMRAAYVGAKVAGHVIMETAGHILAHGGEDAIEHVGEHELEDVAEHTAEHELEDGAVQCAIGESFAASTLVATPTGAVSIASLKPGEQVTAYDPKTGKPSPQTVQATYMDHDTDLLDITLRVTQSGHVPAAPTSTPSASVAQHAQNATANDSKGTTSSHIASSSMATAAPDTTAATTTTHDETIHTTDNHPWFTADHGWLPASFLHLGEPVQSLDGASATVVAIRVVPGAAAMWDLTVSALHDFAVGSGQFVVHNCGYNPHVPDDPDAIFHATRHLDEAGVEGFNRATTTAERKSFLEAAARSKVRVPYNLSGTEAVAHLVHADGYARKIAVIFYRDADPAGRWAAGEVATSFYPTASQWHYFVHELR